MIDWIATLLGYILSFIYNLVQNYGVAIILFTIIVKLLILPLNLKSQKSMAKTQKLTPLIQELQKKYANDQQKLNQEMMELYKANGASPTAGCLPLLIQFPIIIGLYRAIQAPIKFICHGDVNILGEATVKQYGASPEIAISSIADKLGHPEWQINYNFLGLDLSKNPSEAFGVLFSNNTITAETWSILLLLLIPVLAGLTSWLLTKLNPQQRQMEAARANNPQQDQQPNMSKTMNMMMPLMSVFFTFTLAAGIGVYWIISNVFQMVLQYATFKYFKSKEDETSVINTIKPNRKDSKKHR